MLVFLLMAVEALASSAHVHADLTLDATTLSCHEIISERYPKQYVAFKTNTPPVIDGVLNDSAWAEVGWTDPFVDISTSILPKFQTKVKIRWDDEWLYVAGHLHDVAVWANITHTCHCYDPSEDQVIFHDNDFEVFVDADGTCHYYKEYEMNAANQNWDLCLNKPYENNGYENSTRVFGKHGFDMVPPLLSGVEVLNGALNNPASHPEGWTTEIAFPMQKLAFNTSASLPPKPGQFWRINFSRVEWAVKIINNTYVKTPFCQSCFPPGSDACDNWVWSPMHAVDMHHPELWGFLQFADDSVNMTKPVPNVEWPERYVAHETWYAQQSIFSRNGTYSDHIEDVAANANFPSVFDGECTRKPILYRSSDMQHYIVVIASLLEPMAITMNEQRYIQAHYFNETFTLQLLSEKIEHTLQY